MATDDRILQGTSGLSFPAGPPSPPGGHLSRFPNTDSEIHPRSLLHGWSFAAADRSYRVLVLVRDHENRPAGQRLRNERAIAEACADFLSD
jgi:hypothetical protein